MIQANALAYNMLCTCQKQRGPKHEIRLAHYISEKLHLADSLLVKADDTRGFDNEVLMAIVKSTLRDIGRLAGHTGKDGDSCILVYVGNFS